jgi:hypothetical protein
MRKVGINALEIFSLSVLVFAQPILQLLQTYPQALIARHFQFWGISYVVLLVLLLPPVILVSLELLFLKWPGAYKVAHLTILSFLFLLFGQLLMRQLGVKYLGDNVSICGAVAVAAASTFLCARFKSARTFVQILSPSIVIVPLLFFLSPSIRKVYATPPVSVQPKIESRTNVVLIIFDEFSANSLMDEGHNIDAVRFPHVAELPKQFTWYRHASASADETKWAVPAILTGRYPEMKKNATLADYPDNLFTLLAASYELEVREQITDLCPRKGDSNTDYVSTALDMLAVYLQLVVPESYSSKFPSLGGQWTNFWGNPANRRNGEGVAWEFEAFLDSMRPRTKPALYFIHSYLPHAPWYFFPSGKKYDVQSAGPFGIPAMYPNSLWGHDYWPLVSSLQRYLLTLGYLDRLVGRLMDRLHQEQLFDNSLIIVTADHGIAFEPGDQRRAVTPTNFSDIMNVPLFVKLPQQTVGSINDEKTETIDILPTIADVLNIRVGWKMDGVSLFDPSARKRPTQRILKGMSGGGYLETNGDIVNLSKTLAMESRLGLIGKPFSQSLQVGPAPELLGQALSAISAKPDKAFVLQLNFPEHYRSVNPDADTNPNLVSGRIYCALNKPFTIAVAVNGVVRATTQTFLPYYNVPGGFGFMKDPSKEGVFYFTALVPEGLFQRGRNEIQVLVIPKPGDVSLAVEKGS